MNNTEITTAQSITKTVNINASTEKVWNTLTNPELMKLWMSDSEIDIVSEWKVGSSIIISGNLHGIKYENKGTIQQLEQERVFEYSYWSKLSRRPDKPENYSYVKFELTPSANTTILKLTQKGLATEATYNHSNYYWNTVLSLIKKLNER